MGKLFNKLNKQKEEVTIELDPQQDLAVNTKSNKVLVVAGAGSGKTRVLTERVKHLLNEGVTPSNIVAITFTNMASEEMKERLANVDNIGDVFIGTIHSFANKVLKASSKETYKILNTEIYNAFHKELIEKYCKFLTVTKFLRYQDRLEAYNLGRISKEEFHRTLKPSEYAELLFIQGNRKPTSTKAYPKTIKDLCKERNVITFDDLLKLATDYFRNNNSEIEHLLIDEFQDIGMLEYKFFESLKANNVYYVGDDWQSLYGFKGGSVNIMLNLAKDKNYEVISINNNYRNSKEVLKLATTVINQVHNKIFKKVNIPSDRETGEVIFGSKYQFRDMAKRLLKDEENLKDWFVLVRTNKELMEIHDILNSLKIRNTPMRREGLSLVDLNNLMHYNSVKVMTVHTSKGLEAQNVILYGNFPVEVPRYRNNQEERKVMYVGITRAKENLILLNK